MDINLEYYRAFYYVAKYGSVSKAANALYLTQGAVSHTIKNLEKNLGCTLFVRSPKGMILTRAGEFLLGHVSVAFGELEKAELEIQSKNEDIKGEIIIDTSETALYSFLMPVIKAFSDRYPEVVLNIHSCSTKKCVIDIENGNVDVSFVAGPFYNNNKLRKKFIKTLQDVFIYSPEYFPEFSGRKVTLSEVINYPLICLEEGTASRAFIDKFFVSRNLELKPAFNVRTTSSVLPFVEYGLGLGIVLDDFPRSDSISLIDLEEDIPSRDLQVVSNKEHPKSYICKVFLNFLNTFIE